MKLCLPMIALWVATVLAETPSAQAAETPPTTTRAAARKLIPAGTENTPLKNLRVIEGLHVELAATAPVVLNPVGVTIADNGELYVLERRQATGWRRDVESVTLQDGMSLNVDRFTKESRDVLKRISDSNNDGVFDAPSVVMDDLDAASAVLHRDGWWYIALSGRVVRRTLVPVGTTPAGLNGYVQFTRRPASMPGQEFIEHTLVRGLSGFDQRQGMGLSFSPDGSLFIAVGAGDHRAEGADGSRAIVLRTGAVLRCRADGFDLHEVARGFRAPYGALAFDRLGNALHVDANPLAEATNPRCRLLQIHDGNDFGWRLAPAAADLQCDTVRSVLDTIQPGMTSAVAELPAGTPTGLVPLEGRHFPAWLRGAWLYADPQKQVVRALRLDRRGGQFQLIDQFDLLSASDDPDFRPCALEVGSEGAIYVGDCRSEPGTGGVVWKTATGGRLYRLVPSELAPRSAVPAPATRKTKSKTADEREHIESLVEAVHAREPDARRKLLALIPTTRNVRDEIPSSLNPAKRDDLSDAAAIALIGALCEVRYDVATQMVLAELATRDSDVGRFSAEAFVRRATLESTAPNVDTQIARLTFGIKSRSPDLRCASAAVLSKIGQLWRQRDMDRIKQITQTLTTALLQSRDDEPRVFNALARSVEQLGEPAIRQISMHVTQRRSPSLDAAFRALEAMHSRPTARIWEAVLFGDTSHLSVDQQRRLARVYRHIQVEPPVTLTTLAAWLVASEDADPQARLDGLETLLACQSEANREELAETIAGLLTELGKSTDEVHRSRIQRLTETYHLTTPR